MNHAFFHQHLQFTRSFTKKLNEHLAEVGLYHSQWLIVYYLKLYETSTLVEISSYLHVEKPTISRTVKRLEELQLIEKIATTDKRERRIRLTEKGIHVYEEAIQIVSKFEQALMDGIPEGDKETTLRTIQLLKEKL
ncbi:MarR family transcriptional regulator [Virgibacillus sp. NKC19-16]|uniref:MarR family winged helix-turn-helix transcriptional regulator n=1 Tax=Virgibacillus salidurans TaxID=2831673 RepID=UPI001F20E209|nr:MarR family transcriptional regulator [Virgibacillus sp. NKC19-16]UJL47180.1 MarR family transcriptional regulator [Virgibacillus sp. NKC19-16]